MIIAICDVKLQYCEQIENFVRRLGNSLGIDIKCDKYQNGKDLLESNHNQYQIIFLDVDMPDENGIFIAEKIRKTNQDVEIIFVTALIQYAVEGYKVKAYRFILKPIEYEDFVFQIKDLLLHLNNIEKNSLTLTKKHQTYTVKIDEIIYVEILDHYLTYHCTKYNLTVNGTMRKLENDLKNYSFSRIHNSYLVNLEYISEIKCQTLFMTNGDELPIARSKRDAFRQSYLNFSDEKIV